MGGSEQEPTPAQPVRIAVDLLGGDGRPDAILSGVAIAMRRDSGLHVLLVGPRQAAERPLAGGDDPAGRRTVVPAAQVVGMGEDPVRGVRAKPDSSVCVAARMVRDGAADAMVSIGSTGAAMAATVLDLGLLPGLTRPALVVIVPAAAGPVVLLDVGANAAPAAEQLSQHAILGAAYATARLGISEPRVGLLTNGEEVGKGDRVRRSAAAMLAALPLRYVGNVEGHDVPRGNRADVVVTDGFTGNILLKGMEGTYALLATLTSRRLARRDVSVRRAVRAATAHLHPERIAGALLLGVNGVVVVGHGASSPRAVAACIEQAASAVRDGVLPRLRESLAALTARRGPAVVASLPVGRALR